jgi:acetylornithine deacetylase/succinyl-diaminopimelate desuccinylase-like protein
VDVLKKPFVDRLATAVAIPSVSADASYRPEVHKMGQWLAKELKALDVKYAQVYYADKVLKYVLSGNTTCRVLN